MYVEERLPMGLQNRAQADDSLRLDLSVMKIAAGGICGPGWDPMLRARMQCFASF